MWKELGSLNVDVIYSFRSDVPRPGLAKMRAIRLTQMMDCPISNTNYKEMIECLRKVDAKKITKAISEFYVSLNCGGVLKQRHSVLRWIALC